MGVCQGNCQNCNSTCNWSCNNCNTCNSCNSSCEGACQSNKQLASTAVGNFCFRKNTSSTQLKTDDTFLTSSEWNNLLNYIVKGYSLKGQPLTMDVYDYQDKTILAGSNNLFMSAHMYNGAIAKMRYSTEGTETPGTYEKVGGPTGDIIYAKYFRDLEDYFNDKFSVNYCNTCDNCNSCNASCEGCNSCNSCQVCQGNDSCCECSPQ